jgi:RecA-family ATPase
MELFDKEQAIMNQESSRPAADEVRSAETPQPTSIVPGFIYTGVTMLINDPKMGMPSLCLGMALEVARGGQVFGMDVKDQDVLYLAPAATEPRLGSRLNKMLQDTGWPARFELVFKAKRLDEPDLEELEERLTTNPQIRLVVIDNLARFRSRKQQNDDADYEEIARLKAIADRHTIALVLVHHQRQAGLADFFAPAGGLIETVDTLAILERRPYQRGATLRISGHHCKRMDLALNKTTGCWELSSQQIAWRLTQARQEIRELFRQEPRAWTVQEIAKTLGKKKTNVANILAKLVKQRILWKPLYGIYCLLEGPSVAWQAEGRISKKRLRGMTVAELDASMAQLCAKIVREVRKFSR